MKTKLKIQTDVSLAEFTTLKIGGKARFFVSAKSEAEIVKAVEFAEKNNLEIFVLGGGSNVLISDAGFGGLVLRIALKGISTFREKGETVFVTAQAGENWDELVAFCVENNWQGIECLSGIPGFVGAAPVQNVGAYGQEVSETIVTVRVFDRKTREIKELSNSDCGFAYRTSIFNTTEKNRYIVLAATYALKAGGEPKIVYADLIKYFSGKKPSLKETRNAVIKIRSDKSMVIDGGDDNSKSAGSFFKNPMVTKRHFLKIVEKAKNLGIENVPCYEIDADSVKIPAAWLIEKSGFYKGFIFGNAGLSSKHALAIINRGGAKADDILKLKDEIQAKVKEKFEVELIPEPVFVGFS